METDRRPVAVVLAGGLARRMGGGDKPLRMLAGRALLDHVLDRIRPQVRAVALSANGDPVRFAPWGLPVLADPLPGNLGPLAGVLAGMRWAAALGAADVLSVPADTPFLPVDLVAGLAAARRAAAVPIACAASLGRTHPVVALWPTALADALAVALRGGERQAGRWAARQGATAAEFEAAGGDPFFNVNSPGELAEAEALLASPATDPAECRAPDRPGPARSAPPAIPSARRSR